MSPLLGDIGGLPPLLVLVGTRELLLDDSRRLAAKASEAGTSVTVDVHDGLIHVWPFVDEIPESAAALDHIASWISVHPA